ncbi:MAG: hypothetical protein H6Q26_3484 [Bacteroidetes bacterium]|uniref:EboA domain-containing protein n=1 Tax=Chitinophaga sp. LS1 TaxID=3051176 RepID=UPI001DF2B26B|nr:EboA domain-containing protein [Chitinophaga sp. LS1]MBP1653327.1 hypothetical protein [Bacteroidota bacterium]WPV67696.1 EboA domain-containing protein [Chitinophaga sp. LS1]
MEPYYYDCALVKNRIHAIIATHSTPQALNWLQQQLQLLQEAKTTQRFNITFTAMPRFTGKQVIPDTHIPEADNFFIYGYTLDRLARIWWLLQFPSEDRSRYVAAIEDLFSAADMNEQITLYGALPLLAYGEEWKLRTAEGIRSNIGGVLEAIMVHNSYPAQYLDEPAWNQLVMKAIFTDKPVHLITGLDERANPALAQILIDYAHERWAAGRKINPMLWRLIAPFIDHEIMPDINRIWASDQIIDKEAAALACAHTGFAPAKVLLQQSPELAGAIADQSLTWNIVAEKANA